MADPSVTFEQIEGAYASVHASKKSLGSRTQHSLKSMLGNRTSRYSSKGEGAEVGLADGSSGVGSLVGSSVEGRGEGSSVEGCGEGSSVEGNSEGMSVGSAVGNKVGSIVGCVEGLGDGDTDGVAVGLVEGNAVFVVGIFEGEVVGCSVVGDWVVNVEGNLEGEAVG